MLAWGSSYYLLAVLWRSQLLPIPAALTGNLLDDAHYPGEHNAVRCLLHEHITSLTTAK